MELAKRILSSILSVSLAVTSLTGITLVTKEEVQAEESKLSNPRIVTDSSMESGQKVTWDCIWFGSYPQAEVVPSSEEYTALSEKLLQEGNLIKDDMLYQTLQAITGWDEQGDIVIGSDKYRRIKKEDATDTHTSTLYYQWENETDYHYFKYQPIKWRVLSVNGTEAFLLADKVLDNKQYHTVSESITWEGSTIRSWLNGYGASANKQNIDYSRSGLINVAFSKSERSVIVDTHVENTENGNDTIDKVFLLSGSEIHLNVAKKYGFVSENTPAGPAKSINDEARRAKSSLYAKAQGNGSSLSTGYIGNCWWHLRHMVDSSVTRTINQNISPEGNELGGASVNMECGVRPALNLNLTVTDDAGFSNLWSYAGTVCSDGTVKEADRDDEISETGSLIVEAVNKYATSNDTLLKMISAIDKKNLPYDIKMQLMNDICMQYGYTDLKEGIEYIRDATSAQIAYNALVHNEQYGCWNFGYYLNNTTQGKIARGLLYADGLIFNNELGAWLNPGTYMENDYPGIKKYKTLLAKFIKDSSTECEIYIRANQVLSTVNDMLNLKKIDDGAELEKSLERLFEATNSAEQERIINNIFNKDKLVVIDGKYITVKNEAWGKAFGIASKTLRLAVDSTNDILAFFDISTRMKLYQEYDVFFEEIINSDDLPFELRAAAYCLRDEVQNNYFEPIKDLLLHSLKNAASLQDSIQEVIIEEGELESLLGEATLTIKIGAFCTNILVNMGGLVKNAAYTNGYAYLTAFYANLLEESRTKFCNNKTEENAWDFYNKYNILYRLRIAGEETYLELNGLSPDGIMGWGGYLLKYAFDYDSKRTLVENNVSFLKEYCKFQLPNAITVPKTYQFSQKAIITCPVDVKVLDSNGIVIATIADGSTSDVSNRYGRFMSVYKPYSKDYTKVIYLNDDGNYTYQIIGNKNGLVSLQMFDGGDTVTGFRNVTVDKKTIITTTTDDTITTYGIDSNADGKIDKQEKLQQEKEKMDLLLSLSIPETECYLKINEHKQLSYQYKPLNAVNSHVSWKIEDTSVASITQDGEIKALNVGTTTAYCISTSVDKKGDNIMSYCTITVEDSAGDKPNESISPEVSNSPIPTAGSLENPTVKPSIEPIVDPTVKPSEIPSPTPLPNSNSISSSKPSGNWPIAESPTATSNPNGILHPTIIPNPIGTLMPEPTAEPTKKPTDTVKPHSKPVPVVSVSPNIKEDSKADLVLKKGSKVIDKNTKAIYKVTNTGKSKTVEYVKSIKKHPVSITVPNMVKLKGKVYKVASVGKNAFKGSKKLKTMKVGKNVKIIGKQAFFGCTKLTNVTLGKNVTVIGASAFSNCTALIIITIPFNVTKIGDKAFYQCKSLRYVLVKTKKLIAKDVGNNAFNKGAVNLRVKTNKSKRWLYFKIFTARGMSKKALFIIDPVKLVI